MAGAMPRPPGLPDFHDLVQALHGSSRSSEGHKILQPGAMRENIQRLRDVQRRSADDDHHDGPPPCRVRVVGDPEIVDSKGRYHHYYGPALLVNMDNRGMVRSLQYVGVREDNDYISEVWHYDVSTQRYKYLDLSQMQGVSSFNIARWNHGRFDENEPQFRAGDVSWASEAEPFAVPPQAFLEKFQPKSDTFFVDCRSGNFVRGPEYEVLKKVIENPSKFVKPLFRSCSMDPDVWMQLAAAAIEQSEQTRVGHFPRPSREMKAVQVAQLVYGLTARVADAH
mmetsp:Transcript_3888/g.10414  ORF Transcript_3888/g.10414 Transcript_3888/m.10414 type:complete len:281 (-) Transcript_3888:125-967(-)